SWVMTRFMIPRNLMATMCPPRNQLGTPLGNMGTNSPRVSEYRKRR
ncbi:uncharacterized protein METZ01_LOCUS448934, partial [marine metagenome]